MAACLQVNFRSRDFKNILTWKKTGQLLTQRKLQNKSVHSGSLGSRSHRLHMEIKLSWKRDFQEYCNDPCPFLPLIEIDRLVQIVSSKK